MSLPLRKQNEEGIECFREYLAAGAAGPAPVQLLDGDETSEQLSIRVVTGSARFASRFEFGLYLRTLLKEFDPAQIANDPGFWSALALVWFDQLCPPAAAGKGRNVTEYRYVLSTDYRTYYRHLVRSPWLLVRDHGENAKFLLTAPREQAYPLSTPGDIFEQIGSRQQVVASKPIIKAANRMYFDTKTGRPRTGVAGRGKGCAERFGTILRQFALTYDPECMPDGKLLEILPVEFERWKPRLVPKFPTIVETSRLDAASRPAA